MILELVILYVIMGAFTAGWSAARFLANEHDTSTTIVGTLFVAIVWPVFLGKFIGDKY